MRLLAKTMERTSPKTVIAPAGGVSGMAVVPLQGHDVEARD